MIGGYAVLLAVAFLAQLASIFMAMELRTEVNKNITPTSEIISELNKVRFWTGFPKMNHLTDYLESLDQVS